MSFRFTWVPPFMHEAAELTFYVFLAVFFLRPVPGDEGHGTATATEAAGTTMRPTTALDDNQGRGSTTASSPC